MALQACGQSSVGTPQLQLRSLAADSPLRSASWRGSFTGRSLKAAAVSTARGRVPQKGSTVCNLGDFVGGDLVGLDLGQWADDVENYGAVGFYSPPEGGAECRYGTVLKYRGYHFLHVSARGLGDPEAYLLKTHGVRPPHLGKQAVARFYYPGEVDARLAVLPPRYKGIVVWVGEAKVLSKNELQFLAILPALRPKVKVVCEMGGSRKFNWKPLKDIVGLPATTAITAAAGTPLPADSKKEAEPVKEKVLASS